MNNPSTLDRLRPWLALLPLLLLLGATYWLNQQVRPLSLRADENKRHDPDVIVSDFSATALNEQGLPHFVMSAREMVHFPDDDSTHLDKLQLKSLYADQPPVYTSAQHGEISQKGDEVFLHDDVSLVRAATAQQSAMTFATSYLHIVPEHDLADTDAPVTMTDAHNVIRAVGMRFDSHARTIKLLAQVRSQHEIAKP
jgi:lipopolysaccharide export system protein LptC